MVLVLHLPKIPGIFLCWCMVCINFLWWNLISCRRSFCLLKKCAVALSENFCLNVSRPYYVMSLLVPAVNGHFQKKKRSREPLTDIRFLSSICKYAFFVSLCRNYFPLNKSLFSYKSTTRDDIKMQQRNFR